MRLEVFTLGGLELLLDPGGAVFVPSLGTLIVSDLHLEKGSYFAERGQPLPPYDSLDTLARIETLVAAHEPTRIVSLGDSFHDASASDRMAPAASARLTALVRCHDWVWIAGNHDPLPPEGMGGKVCDELRLGPVMLRHEPLPGAELEIAGHLHPCASVTLHGRRLQRRCFVGGTRRLVMPAFGAYAGGLDVTDPAIVSLFGGERFSAFLMGAQAVYRIPLQRLGGAQTTSPWRLKSSVTG